MALANVFNEESFNPARLSNLSLWLDAQSPSTISSSGGSPTLILQWTVISGAAQSGVSLSLDQTILYSLTFETGVIAKISLLTGVITLNWVSTGGPIGARTMITGIDGNLYITNSVTNSIIRVITTTGAVNTTWCTGVGLNPLFCIQATDTNFYVVSASDGRIVQISPAGTILNSSWASELGTNIRAIAQGIDGNFYVTTIIGTIIQISPTGVVLNQTWVSGLTNLRGIVKATDGDFYVAGHVNGTIIKISPTGVVLNTAYVSGLTTPYQIASSTDGVLYVSSTVSMYISKVVLGSFYWTDKSSNANNFYKVTGANPLISNTLVNQPSVFLPPTCQLTSTLSANFSNTNVPVAVSYIITTTTASGTFTITIPNPGTLSTNSVQIIFGAVGGGGGGGGGSLLAGSGYSGGGGGQGGTTIASIAATLPATLTYTVNIGSGGAAGLGGSVGGIGGDTSLIVGGTTYTAGGGRGGVGGVYGINQPGGVGGSGTIVGYAGGQGGEGNTAGAQNGLGGGGLAISVDGGGGGGGPGGGNGGLFNSIGSPAAVSSGAGGGGGGYSGQRVGGAGGAGFLTITVSGNGYRTAPGSRSIFMVYQCVSPQSVMRFSTGNDVSGQAFGFAQSNSTVYSPYQYGYGDTKWTVDANTYILPNFVSGIVDVSATMIRGDYNFNAGANVRETALQNIIENTPYTLGTSTVSSSVFVSASFHVCEIIAYNRALSTTDRQMIEGYVAWKWNMVTRLPNGHPYQKFPPSGEQVIDPATPSNIFTGLVSWIDMADTSTYTLSGTFLKTLNDKVGGSFTISGRPDSLPVSTIGGLPSLNFPGNVTRTITALTNPFLYKTLPVPSEGCAIAVMIPSLQFTAAKLGIFGWGAPGNGSNNPGLGYTPETNNLPAAIQSYNTATSVFFGPSLRPTIGSPAIIFWAWYGGNMVYLSSNGNTILSSPQTAGVYDKTSTNNIFYIGNDEGLGANFNLGELCVYDGFLETPFRNIMEGYLAWKWGMTQFLPTNHPHYLASPTLQTLTEVNALSQPADISGLTMWVDAADTTTTINTAITPSVVLTGSYTFLATADGYDYYRFTGNGTVQTNIPLSVQYLAVGGGGGGASALTAVGVAGGGGGSGGLKTNTSTLAVAGQSLPIPSLVANTTYTIVVGGGGNAGIFNPSTQATNGGSTTFTGEGINVIANGGGFGIKGEANIFGGAADAGSGAGGGFGGNSSQTAARNAGAGGGVLSAGGPGNSTTPGAGGNGLVFLTVPLGAGGGAGGYNKSGVAGSAGGTVIGGAGGVGPTGGGAPAGSGTANTGSGGGGGGQYGNGAAGGSGVFILGIPSILPTRLFTWLDKSAVSNNLVSSGSPPTISNFGTPLRPSIYFGPGTSLQSTYNSGAASGPFTAFLVASAPASSYLLISTGQITQSTTLIVGQSFSFFSKSGVATPNVLSPYIVDGTGAANNVVGLYSTISGKTFELFATISGKTIGGSMNFATPPPAVTNTVTAVTATPWIFGDCTGDTIPKSFHVHEFITYSRTLLEYERQIVEGYLYWKWLI